METRPRDGVEIFWRSQPKANWQQVAGPRAVQMHTDSSGILTCTLECTGIGADYQDYRGEFLGEVILQKHFIGSTEVRYLPKALIYYRFRDNILEIRSVSGEQPRLNLPSSIRQWENPHASFWSYTASALELTGLIELLKNATNAADSS